MDSKTRSKLNSLAMTMEPLVYIGKNGITQMVIDEINTLLDLREIIKLQVQKGADLTAKEAMQIVCDTTKALPITAIGNRFVIYRLSKKDIKHIL